MKSLPPLPIEGVGAEVAHDAVVAAVADQDVGAVGSLQALVVAEHLVVVAAAGRAAAAAEGDPQVVVGAGVGDGVFAAAAVEGVALAGDDRGDEQVVAGAAEQVVAAGVGVEDVAAAVAVEPVVAVVRAVVVLARFQHVVAVAADQVSSPALPLIRTLAPAGTLGSIADGVVAVAAGDHDQRRPGRRRQVSGVGVGWTAAVAGEDRPAVEMTSRRRRRARRGGRRRRGRPGRSGWSRRGPG